MFVLSSETCRLAQKDFSVRNRRPRGREAARPRHNPLKTTCRGFASSPRRGWRLRTHSSRINEMGWWCSEWRADNSFCRPSYVLKEGSCLALFVWMMAARTIFPQNSLFRGKVFVWERRTKTVKLFCRSLQWDSNSDRQCRMWPTMLDIFIDVTFQASFWFIFVLFKQFLHNWQL